jgi:hypothetical protein
MYKFWGQIWVKWDQKREFWVKIGEFPRGNNQEQGVCSGAARCGELHVQNPVFLGVLGALGPIWTVQTDSFDVFNCCYVFLLCLL